MRGHSCELISVYVCAVGELDVILLQCLNVDHESTPGELCHVEGGIARPDAASLVVGVRSTQKKPFDLSMVTRLIASAVIVPLLAK